MKYKDRTARWALSKNILGQTLLERLLHGLKALEEGKLSIPENTEPLNWQIIWENF